MSRRRAPTIQRQLRERRQREGGPRGDLERVVDWLLQVDEDTFYKWQRRGSDTIAAALRERERAAGGAVPDEAGQVSAEAEAWFAREAALLGALCDPRIPACYGAFCQAGRSYLAQEYVRGETLEALMRRRGPLPERAVLAWARALCGLLCYLHGRPEPVIFRDLKPDNILLRPDGRLAVVDFGIARPLLRAARRLPGTTIGTPGYAPPEQYQGLADERSDIYALGATLHRLLTGYDPEQGPPFTFPPVRDLNPRVSRELAAVVARAVALDPAARYATAEGLLGALDVLVLQRASRARMGIGALTGTLIVGACLALAGLSSQGPAPSPDSTFSGNSGPGGGIENYGTLIVTNSAFRGNGAKSPGVQNFGRLGVINSTFSGNDPDIENFGKLSLTNNTFGGGIQDFGCVSHLPVCS